MPPKAAKATAPKKASSAGHASYKDMIKVAIVNLKDRMGSSRQAIKKYILQNNSSLSNTTEAAFAAHFSQALNAGEKAGEFLRPKGPSGPVKLAKKPAAAAKASSPTATKKAPAAKKTAAPKKAGTTTKAKTTTAATKKPTAAKKAAAPKKAAATTKTKANTAKPRKSAPKKAAPAPAVADEKPVVLGKTKSGRVTKGTPKPAAAKKAAPKKTAAKKTATPKAAAAAA